MFWNILKPMWESLAEKSECDFSGEFLKCEFSITEFFLIELILNKVIDINKIVFASRDFNKYTFPENIDKTLVDKFFKHSEKTYDELKVSNLDRNEELSFLPLGNNILNIKIIMKIDEYLEFLHALRKFTYWEAKTLLKSELKKMNKIYPLLVHEYFSTSKNENDTQDKQQSNNIDQFEEQFKKL